MSSYWSKEHYLKSCLLTVVLLGLVACTSVAAAQATVARWIRSGSVQRRYLLYVPAGYRPGTPTALVLNLHALGSDDAYQQYYGDFRPIADTANFLVLHPNGEFNANGQRTWNVFDEPGTGTVDDVAFISAALDTVCAEYSVDKTRIYSTGMSNGGFMSYELACQLSSRIAAVASVAGTQNVTRLAICAPVHPTPVLAIHGTTDYAVPYAGTDTGLTGTSHWASVTSILDYWIQYNGCVSAPTVTPVPDSDPSDGCTAERMVWANGRNGSSVEHYRIIDGEHTWPGALAVFGRTNYDINASVVIWRFFRRYRLGQLSAPVALSAWPNPVEASGVVYVQADAHLQASDVQLLDALGREVPTRAAGLGRLLTLDGRNWPAGVYYLQVRVNGKIYRQKLVK